MELLEVYLSSLESLEASLVAKRGDNDVDVVVWDSPGLFEALDAVERRPKDLGSG